MTRNERPGDDRSVDSLPVRRPNEFPERVVRPDATVHGVVLAAGTSTRYGSENKLLEPLDGRPLVRCAVEALVESDVDDVTVVVGHEADRVRETIADLPVETVENPRYEDGLGSSVRLGVSAAADRNADAVLLVLGDMPWVDASSIDLLVDAYARGVGDAIAAAYRGRRGNPVLFDSRLFDALTVAHEGGDVGGRGLLTREHGALAIETGDSGVVRDVDRTSDLERSG